jgi:aspartyl-tRNA(Asn)/glutamyl-tRNA(Gln) amidotransferase subunit C
MSVSEQDVDRVAELANLELTASEKVQMLRDLNSVLGYFAQLNELDTSSVPPMAQVANQVTEAGEPGSSAQRLRQDDVVPSLSRAEVMACAPDTDGTFFKVPKVLER